MSLQIDDGTWIRGAPVVGVNRTYNQSWQPLSKITWITDRLEISTTFIIRAYRMHEADGRLILQTECPVNIHVTKGSWMELNPEVAINSAV